MKLNNDQKILVFVNDEFKFAHIGVFNMIDKKGRPNYSGSLSAYMTEANRVKNLLPSNNDKGTENAFGNSFLVRLMNTNNVGWDTREEYLNVSLSDVDEFCLGLSEKYDSMGYSITGSMGRKAIRQTGMKGVTNLVIKNATRDRLYAIAEKLVEGIQNVDIRRVQVDIYKQYVFNGLDTRRKFYRHIIANMEKYLNSECLG